MNITFDYSVIGKRLYPTVEDDPLDKVCVALPKTISDALHDKKCWIAGGFIRRWFNNLKQDSDIDLFFKDKETYDAVCKHLTALTLSPAVETLNNTRFKILVEKGWEIEVQCIKIAFYKDVDAVLDSFDFTICQFAFDGKNIIATELAVIDSGRKRLVPHKITYGVSSLRRIIKYTKQGYYMCGGAATEFLTQVVHHPEAIRADVVSVD